MHLKSAEKKQKASKFSEQEKTTIVGIVSEKTGAASVGN